MTNQTLTTNKSQKEKFLNPFTQLGKNGKGMELDIRAKAIEALKDHEIPTRKWEAWKYTDLKTIANRDYQFSGESSLDQITSFQIPDLEADQLVFINGVYQDQFSSLTYNQNLVTISPISELQGEDKSIFETHLGSLINGEEDIFSALNTAYAQEGVFIRVKRGKNAVKPIHIIHISQASEQPLATQFRNLFLIEENSSVEVIESQHSVGEGVSFSNSVTEILVRKNAGVEYVKLQLESDQASQINSTVVYQEDDSRASVFTITMSGETVRNNLRMRLDGQNIESHLMGINLLSGSQHVDHHTEVHHLKPHCFSNELYKGIMSEMSTGVFNGKIHVYPDAQKTNAFQSNRNILLSDTANIYTKPQLEIYADDVKCSHGATTGRLDEEAMFYLRARGIKEYDARIMLIYAFAMEVVDNISIEPVRNFISSLIQNRF
ncbi:MAG: Fe-S cluster assembly protein SufD [Bacteroidetes bacterium]|nr:Fe-S cluster assembly protein SufD [Bacteroidota bacterium]